MNGDKRFLDVVKVGTVTEFRVRTSDTDAGKLVMSLEDITFERARTAAYNYIWDHGKYMWTIRGIVE
jgi:hypothetical protein